MEPQTKQCQNCKQDFVIEPDDFGFYEKMKVPTPTFCPECRFQRRLMFRNERVLYKRKCDLCSQPMVTVFSPEKPFKVYCSPCWWSDKWDAAEYAMEYDPSKNFFEQYKEFQKKVPFMNLFVTYATLVNSDYVNHVGDAKNCYLIFNASYNENVYYGVSVDGDKDSMDALRLVNSELCYEIVMSVDSYKVFFSEDCRNCTDVYFSKALRGCSNCFGCINLQNKSYYIFNKPYSKEEYKDEIKKFNLNSFSAVEELKKKSREFWIGFPNRFMVGVQNENVSGDYISYSKNAHHMYQARGAENAKFCQWITLPPAKDMYDLTEWGNGAELIYDSITVGEGANTVKFSFGAWNHVSNVEYSMFVNNCSNVFGCLNLKKKSYCIFNKQYSKEEYEILKAKIIEDMNKNPYVDSKGRVFKYGEFFPYDLSFFDYNETNAMQLYPLTEEQVLEKGWRWDKTPKSNYKITIPGDKIPDSINDVNESILQEILGCINCGKAFKMVRGEYDLLKRFGFPVPPKCPDCRHMERMVRVNPPKLWDRTCAKCKKDIQTSYAPDRPEIVYCEQCYQQEVV
ncbi:MAG: hypothetical protein EXS48_02820 [Candidatus Staskawiczbacteria bacterium]|nr:hypothetical protein [Candidatus Staskawiczbacteria bacterium]